jgi:hypothetical protein
VQIRIKMVVVHVYAGGCCDISVNLCSVPDRL